FEELHLLTPGMAWSHDSKRLALAAKSGSQDAIIIIDVNEGDEQKLEFDLDGIFSVDWSPGTTTDASQQGKLAFVGNKNGRSDIYTYDLDTKQLTNLTDDIFSDADPAWSSDGTGIYFSSDRTSRVDRNGIPPDFKMQRYDFGQVDLYRIDVADRKINRITELPNSDETSPVATADGKHLLFISDMNGINNIYVKNLDSGTVRPVTNSLSGVYQLSISQAGDKLAFSSLTNGGFDLFLMRGPLDRNIKLASLEPTEYFRRLTEKPQPAPAQTEKQDSLKVAENVIIKMDGRDSTDLYGKSVQIDLKNYVFNDSFRDEPDKKIDSLKPPAIKDNVDQNGNYKVSKYKLNFSPDIIYGNAGYSTFYGVQGSTLMAFSDMLGDHQIYLLTNLLFDLKNSDYALAYLFLPKRVDYGVQIFHSARFLILEDNVYGDNLYRFRNYGITGLASYPIDKFNRFEFNLSWFNITKDNLDIVLEPSQRRSLILPGLSYIHDTSLWGLIAPTNGERYNVSVIASPKVNDDALGFYSITADYRTYLRLGKSYTFAVRLAGGGSFGQDPQRFIIGGVDNWINRQFENNRIPVDRPEDYVFLTSGIPLRGYNYNARIGTKYGLTNFELRFPLFGYLSAGPLPIFFQTLNGVLFLDVGAAWTDRTDFKSIDKDVNGNIYLRDILSGMGYGVRMVFLGFLLKMDVAWSFDLHEFSVPKYYFSVGADI
ncbi:MAG TPA: BamA/TamA family outer membrane protein, partial [Bacteroidota bacterium]|nr:BamA/TamA family outer membrane protein [Bacteroidota bacterium]